MTRSYTTDFKLMTTLHQQANFLPNIAPSSQHTHTRLYTITTTTMAENITVDLDQLLGRLSDTLLSPTADDTHLRTTLYERNRISAVRRITSSFLSVPSHDHSPIPFSIHSRTISSDNHTA